MSKLNDASKASSPATLKIDQLRTDIASIENKLKFGITATTVDGVTIQVSLEALRERLNQLKRELVQVEAAANGDSDPTSCFRPVRF